MLRSLLNQHWQKVERDTEPGGHDARDRKRADQLDLPHHLWPGHLPAVQPACLLWRIPGESNIQWAYGSTNLTTQPCLFAKNHNSFLIFNLHRFLTLAQWRRLKRYLWHISWINRRSGRYYLKAWNENTNTQNAQKCNTNTNSMISGRWTYNGNTNNQKDKMQIENT